MASLDTGAFTDWLRNRGFNESQVKAMAPWAKKVAKYANDTAIELATRDVVAQAAKDGIAGSQLSSVQKIAELILEYHQTHGASNPYASPAPRSESRSKAPAPRSDSRARETARATEIAEDAGAPIPAVETAEKTRDAKNAADPLPPGRRCPKCKGPIELKERLEQKTGSVGAIGAVAGGFFLGFLGSLAIGFAIASAGSALAALSAGYRCESCEIKVPEVKLNSFEKDHVKSVRFWMWGRAGAFFVLSLVLGAIWARVVMASRST